MSFLSLYECVAEKNPLQQTGAMLSTSIVLAVTAVLVFLAVRGFKWDVE
ncbi:hypothetical protein [Bifidobacterium apousia]|nr:hypothetical protein [Bifidobacterium apousia]MBI0123979.1 hypothetical protein [Bifidobacterium apousia]MBI0137490.1 hypothetical protein [Bifidobacterium sp. W8120]